MSSDCLFILSHLAFIIYQNLLTNIAILFCKTFLVRIYLLRFCLLRQCLSRLCINKPFLFRRCLFRLCLLRLYLFRLCLFRPYVLTLCLCRLFFDFSNIALFEKWHDNTNRIAKNTANISQLFAAIEKPSMHGQVFSTCTTKAN